MCMWLSHTHLVSYPKNIKYQHSYYMFDCLFYSTASPPSLCGCLDISGGFVSKMWFPTLCFLFLFKQLDFGRWPSHSTWKLNHLADKSERLLISYRNCQTYKTNQNQRISKNISTIVDLLISHNFAVIIIFIADKRTANTGVHEDERMKPAFKFNNAEYSEKHRIWFSLKRPLKIF